MPPNVSRETGLLIVGEEGAYKFARVSNASQKINKRRKQMMTKYGKRIEEANLWYYLNHENYE